ncbi:MAG: adenosylcobinamide-GDP ribazoletransferase [Synergistaceae bacterium]|jgi:adenosylcobinamide-GDP ribazoletransferase|nr:adenosylcobinamide-GDP ribazoletransferase [Synergistaceae bacterium]
MIYHDLAGLFARITGYARCFADEASAAGFLAGLREQFISVWTLITRIPIPQKFCPSNFALPTAEALTLIPIAGGLFGALAAVIPVLSSLAGLSHPAAAWFACGLYTVLGWGLHLDGWGDVWDGFGSGRRGDELRRVMKDPRTGVFGVAGIVLALASRASLLPDDTFHWLAVCALGGSVGRFGGTVAAYLGKYPWESGMARDVVRDFGGYQLFRSFVFTCVMFPLAPFAWTIGIILSSAAGTALAVWANEKLGGVNGDVIGASSVLGELLTLAVCSL